MGEEIRRLLPGAPASGAQLTSAGHRRRQRWIRRFAPVGWLAPSLLLILVVIAYPAVEMVRSSLLKISSIGLAEGFGGLSNYERLLAEPALPGVVINTVLWVVLVVGITVLTALALAQFLNKTFAGRRLVRWAVIMPWAASLVMTATVWRYIYERDYGILNRVLLDLHVISSPVDWYKDDRTAFWCLVAVGIIVSIPFTTYVVLAGLQTIPAELYEAARIDGAGPWVAYRRVTLPLLRPALVIAVVLNTIYVFNSFPIIWLITGKIPGFQTDTTMTFMYKIAFTYRLDPGEAAALAVLNVLFLLVLVFCYVKAVGFGETDTDAGSGRPGRRLRALWRRNDGLPWRAVSLRPVRAAAGRLLSPGGARLAAAWRSGRRFVLPLIGLVVALFFAAPYVVMVLAALKNDATLFHSPATYLPHPWEWSNFVAAWHKIPLWSFVKASLIIAVAATAIVIAVALPTAYFTARRRFRGRRAFLFLVLVTQMFAPVALVVGLYREVILADTYLSATLGIHVTNTYWMIILVNAAFNLAFAIWILNGFFASIPKEIEDAAMIDGLGRLGVLFRIAVPLAKPGIVTAIVFTFIQVWNEFVVALTLFNDPSRNRETLTVGIQQFVGLIKTEYQYLFVAAVVGIVPVIVLFALIERYLVSGLTAGSIK